MLENITLGQVLIALVFIMSLLTNIKSLIKEFKNPIDKKLQEAIKPITEQIVSLELSSIKTDLINFINDIEHGVPKSQIQKFNAHELYGRYTKLGGNSYVHDHWEKLEKEGKL